MSGLVVFCRLAMLRRVFVVVRSLFVVFVNFVLYYVSLGIIVVEAPKHRKVH